jgi:hypothetical protein
MFGADGQRFKLVYKPDKETKKMKPSPTTTLACVIQSYEVAIISECYRLAQSIQFKDAFVILYHQHDGFMIKIKKPERKEEIISTLKSVFAQKAKSYGVIGFLEDEEN